jgi:chromosome partitioning protein
MSISYLRDIFPLMVLTVGSTKGGVGKTTLALNLTIGLVRSGQDVLLVDGDEQTHALAFTELRAGAFPDGPGYTAVALHGAAIRTQVRQLKNRYDQIVIDVGGRDTGSIRAALSVSDFVLVPAAPRSFDLWGVDSTADVVREMREVNENLRAVAVLNGADARGNDNDEALSALRDIEGLEVSPHRIVRRKAYPNAATRGMGIMEYKDRQDWDGVAKAQADFLALYQSIYPAEAKKGKVA